jgi:hypothetical protein
VPVGAEEAYAGRGCDRACARCAGAPRRPRARRRRARRRRASVRDTASHSISSSGCRRTGAPPVARDRSSAALMWSLCPCVHRIARTDRSPRRRRSARRRARRRRRGPRGRCR